jgi:hypothetical protein
MDKFNIKNHQTEGCNRHFDIQKQNGWTDAYTDVPGKQAYEDGLYTGFTNGYDEASRDIKKYIKCLVEENPKLEVKKILDLIV